MAKKNVKIQRVELSCYHLPLHCPFCGQLVFHPDSDSELDLSPCKHTLFIADDMTFHCRSKRFNQLKNIADVKDDDVDTGDGSYDGYTDDVPVENAIKFAVYIPAPSFFGAYYGFAPTEDE